MLLWLTPDQAQSIAQHAKGSYPLEACGLIAGRGNQAERIVSIPNVADHPQHQFRLDNQAFLQAMFEFERTGLTLIGIYHSHPNGDAIPSQTDIRQAAYPDTYYLIVGLKSGEPAIGVWQIRRHEVNPVELYIGHQQPEPEEEVLSQAQKVAIILATVAAVLFVLLLSLSLLPPAPIIVTPLP